MRYALSHRLPYCLPKSNPSASSLNASQVSVHPIGASPAANDGSASPGVETAVDLPASPALEGYCPVALKNDGKWVEGKQTFTVKHRGKYYWLSSQAAVDQFLKDPDACSPVLAGYDPMLFLKEGKLIDGQVQYGLHDPASGAIMLFTSEASKAAYRQDFERNARALETILTRSGIR